jgi:hypothetical protein
MTPSLRAIAAAIALAAGVSPAFATASASARFDGLRFSLSAIDPSGPDPTITFDAFGGGSQAWAQFQLGNTTGPTSVGQGTDVFEPTSASVSGHEESASAWLSGDVWSLAGASAQVSGSVNTDGTARWRQANGGVLPGGSGPDIPFTLGPNTMLEVFATATTAAQVSPPRPTLNEFASGEADLALYGPGGLRDPAVASFQAYSSAYDYYGTLYPATDVDGEAVDLVLVGSETDATDGVLEMALSVNTQSSTLAPVPEPANAALLLAGVVGVSILRRHGARGNGRR